MDLIERALSHPGLVIGASVLAAVAVIILTNTLRGESPKRKRKRHRSSSRGRSSRN